MKSKSALEEDRSPTFLRGSPQGRHRAVETTNFWGWLLTLGIWVLVILVILGVSRRFLYSTYYIPSESMMNTLQINDRIMVNRLYPSLIPLQRGDVVVFRDSGNWLEQKPVHDPPLVYGLKWLGSLFGISSPDSEGLLVKRVIGLPGDHVACCNLDGRMQINGRAIQEPYLFDPTGPASRFPFSVVVPTGRLWVMGDNRDHSGDSRYHMGDPGGGFVPISDVVGKAFVVYLPLNHFHSLSNYHSETFGEVPKPSSTPSFAPPNPVYTSL